MRLHYWGVVARTIRQMRACPGVQLMAVGALGVALGVVGAYMAAAWAGWELVQGVMAGPRVVVVLEEGVSRERALDIARRIRAMEGVKAVKYVPREEGLKRLKKVVGTGVLKGLGTNPLPDVLEVSLGPATALAGRVRAMQHIPGVGRVLTARGWMAKVEELMRLGKELAVVVGVVLVGGVAGLVGVVVQLGMYARREEIRLMRLLGASGWFIAAPVMLEAALQALGGSVLGWGMLRLVAWILSSPVAVPWALAPALPGPLPGWLWPAMAAVGVGAGIVGAGAGIWLVAGREEL